MGGEEVFPRRSGGFWIVLGVELDEAESIESGGGIGVVGEGGLILLDGAVGIAGEGEASAEIRAGVYVVGVNLEGAAIVTGSIGILLVVEIEIAESGEEIEVAGILLETSFESGGGLVEVGDGKDGGPRSGMMDSKAGDHSGDHQENDCEEKDVGLRPRSSNGRWPRGGRHARHCMLGCAWNPCHR